MDFLDSPLLKGDSHYKKEETKVFEKKAFN